MQDRLCDHGILTRQREPVQKRKLIRDGQVRKVRDVHSAYRHSKDFLLQSCAAAGRTFNLAHAGFKLGPHPRALRFTITALEVVDDALKGSGKRTFSALRVIMHRQLLIARTIEESVLRLPGDVPKRRGELEAVFLRKRLIVHTTDGIFSGLRPAACDNRALHDGERRIGHDQIRINTQLFSEAAAGRAGAVGIVERKHPRRDLFNRDPAILTRVVL